MTALVVFVEEPSARIVVETMMRRVLPGQHVIIVEHEGRSDLQTSFPRKIAAWGHPRGVPFIVNHDNDGNDCTALKKKLTARAPARRRPRTRIRIVMQCLESWYLGDAQALVEAKLIKPPKAREIENSAKFRNPDRIVNAKQEFFRLHDERGLLAVARLIAPYLDVDRNRSISFKMFVQAVRTLTSERT